MSRPAAFALALPRRDLRCRTAREIGAYETSAHAARRSLTAGAGMEKGDPARAAAAILTALDSPEPPRHLLLGEDALHYARDQFAFVESQIAQWESLSRWTAYDSPIDPSRLPH